MTPLELYGPEVCGDPDPRACECCGADLDGYGHPRGDWLLCAICYGSTFVCESCTENIALADLNESPDGQWFCEDCGHDRSYPCERCGERFWDEPTEIDDCSYCEDCAADVEHESRDCPSCRGTGIGYGPPDVSRCGSCGGSGLRRQERDQDADFDHWREPQLYG
jgi:hypothetical protein